MTSEGPFPGAFDHVVYLSQPTCQGVPPLRPQQPPQPHDPYVEPSVPNAEGNLYIWTANSGKQVKMEREGKGSAEKQRELGAFLHGSF